VNIIVVGAGNIGHAISHLLAEENHDVVLIDRNRERLEEIRQDLDVETRVGSGTDWKLLEELSEREPELIIALTNDDESNLVCCSIAKELGYPTTIARVREQSYLNRSRIDFGSLFSVDHLISPDLLVAQDVYKYVMSLASINMEVFAHRAVQMRTMVIPKRWKHGDKNLAELDLPKGIMIGLIRRPFPLNKGHRRDEIIFPHGMDRILPGDEVTFIGKTEAMQELHTFVGIPQPELKAATIVGGSSMGWNLAKILDSRGISVRLIERDYNRCCELAEALPNCAIVHHDGTDLTFLHSEKMDKEELLIGATRHDETNILVGIIGRQAGCERVVVSIVDTSIAPLLHDLGITHTVSARTSMADRILSIARAKSVITTHSLYENQAKIVEMKISLESHIVGIPLAELGPFLPKDLLIAVIQNRGRVMIANGSRTLSPGDTVIVITTPAHANELQKIF
jgi:trk/ktr system potassium uptake protein